MKDFKNIDKLYRERLQNSEVQPPIEAWGNIAKNLQEKPRRKTVLPLWYKIAGIAAALLLAATLALPYINSTFTSNPVVESPYEIKVPKEELHRLKVPQFDSFYSKMANATNILEETIQENENLKFKKRNSIIVSAKGKYTNEAAGINPSEALPSKNSKDAEIAGNAKTPNELSSTNSEVSEIAGSVKTSEELSSTNSEASEMAENSEITSENSLSEAAIALVDTTTTSEEKELQKPINPENRLRLSTKVTPVFFGNNNANEDGSSEGSLSYGLALSYAVSNKISLRSGINRVDINRGSSEIAYANGAKTADFKANSATTLAAPTMERMQQSMNFWELPVEMEYHLTDSKVKLSLIGGGSLLWLQDAQREISGAGYARTLEETADLDKMYYTGNLGVGIGYKILPQIEINLDPVIKFNMNSTGENKALSSYYFGIYSGLSYKF